MKSLKLYIAAVAFAGIVLASCESHDMPVEQKKKETVRAGQDSAATLQKIQANVNEGVIGIFNVPEMLTLSKMDSADVKEMSFKLAKDYSVLEEEVHAIGAELNGSPGVINYNNNPKNFKFECLLLIKKIPGKQPTKCKVVVLEATKMLVYNYYGSYEGLLNAYNKIREYCEENKLTQNGPMREFYVSDPTVETNPAKWLTRIMVPIN